jgi:hypothetical protein
MQLYKYTLKSDIRKKMFGKRAGNAYLFCSLLPGHYIFYDSSNSVEKEIA